MSQPRALYPVPVVTALVLQLAAQPGVGIVGS